MVCFMVSYWIPLIFDLYSNFLLSISIYSVLDPMAGTGTYKAEQDRHCKLHKEKGHLIARECYHSIDSSLSSYQSLFFPLAS